MFGQFLAPLRSLDLRLVDGDLVLNSPRLDAEIVRSQPSAPDGFVLVGTLSDGRGIAYGEGWCWLVRTADGWQPYDGALPDDVRERGAQVERVTMWLDDEDYRRKAGIVR